MCLRLPTIVSRSSSSSKHPPSGAVASVNGWPPSGPACSGRRAAAPRAARGQSLPGRRGGCRGRARDSAQSGRRARRRSPERLDRPRQVRLPEGPRRHHLVVPRSAMAVAHKVTRAVVALARFSAGARVKVLDHHLAQRAACVRQLGVRARVRRPRAFSVRMAAAARVVVESAQHLHIGREGPCTSRQTRERPRRGRRTPPRGPRRTRGRSGAASEGAARCAVASRPWRRARRRRRRRRRRGAECERGRARGRSSASAVVAARRLTAAVAAAASALTDDGLLRLVGLGHELVEHDARDLAGRQLRPRPRPDRAAVGLARLNALASRMVPAVWASEAARIIDGKAVAAEIRAEIKVQADEWREPRRDAGAGGGARRQPHRLWRRTSG